MGKGFSQELHNRPISNWAVILIALPVLGVAIYTISRYYPLGVDWAETFSQISDHWKNPFDIPKFTNPPWVIALLPHAWLPDRLGNAVNFSLNIILLITVARRFGGDWKTLLMVFTSPVFFDLGRTNNIEWIPLLAFLLPPTWGLPILAIKPHALGAAALIWWKKAAFSVRMLIPLFALIGLSFLLWGFWPLEMGLPEGVDQWNFAPWPFGLPLGFYMLYRAYKTEDEILGAVATPFLVPYIAPYSFPSLIALAGGKHRREVFIVYVALWVFFIIETRRLRLGI